MLSENRDNLTSLFLFGCLFLFSLPNALARTFSIMLNTSDESGNPLALNFKFINPTTYFFIISTQMPHRHLKINMSISSSLLHPKMFQLKFCSHHSASLFEGRRRYSWLLSCLILSPPHSLAPFQD